MSKVFLDNLKVEKEQLLAGFEMVQIRVKIHETMLQILDYVGTVIPSVKWVKGLIWWTKLENRLFSPSYLLACT